jgi:manganese-dependent inorganic pyrophosphatase
MQIILVDHNEPSQAIGALDEADLIEVLDHHRLGNPPTKAPIPFTVDPVGSTSTLVSERIAAANLNPPPAIAGLLLAGLMSDTLVLKSPTTTARDRVAAKRLEGWWISGGNAAYQSFGDFGAALLAAGAGLAVRDVDSIVNTDLKIYDGGGIKFGVAQVEVANVHEIDNRLEEIRAGLNALCKSRGLALAVLMVTDVVRGGSRLVLSEESERLNDLPYQRMADGTLDAPDLLSRKKQLLPTILGLLE